MKLILLLFLFSITTISCEKKCSSGGDCTEAELSFLPYQNGQILIFENDSLERDTAIVTMNHDYVSVHGCSEDYNCCRYQIVAQTFPVQNDFLKIAVTHQGTPEIYTKCCREYITSGSTAILFLGTSGIHNVNYSDSKGIISYETTDGNKWHLIQ